MGGGATPYKTLLAAVQPLGAMGTNPLGGWPKAHWAGDG